MRSRVLISTLCAIGLCAATLAAAELASDNMVIKGTVVSAEAGRLTITDTTGKPQSFTVTDTTMILVSGKPAKLQDLKTGARVNVTTGKDNRVLVIATYDPVKG